MRSCNRVLILLGSVMHLRVPVFILAFSTLISGVIACSSQSSRPAPAPFLFIFDERPFQMDCTDRPAPLPPGPHVVLAGSPPYARTRLDTLNLPLNEVSALTIAAESHNWVRIAGANQDHWTVQFCAEGDGNTIDEANGHLQKVSLQRTGGLLTLNNTDARGLTGGGGDLLLTAPAGAPVTVHSDAPVQVQDMAGPVRVSTAQSRATILNTTGRVDAFAMIVDYSGSQGSVALNASWDVEIKLTATTFRGNLSANAQRRVQALFPPGFQTPIEVYVNRSKDFVCRADFCSKIKKDRVNFLYRFTYGDTANVSDHIGLRSENSQVTLDTMQ